MKKLNILKFAAIILLLVVGCKDPDNAIYDVLDNTNYGAALRKIDTPDDGLSKNFNIFDLTSTFEVVVEEQDEEYGKLLSKVDVYVGFNDNANDGANNKAEVLTQTIQASEFDTSEKGLPTTHIKISFQEAIDALNMVDGDYTGGDSFPIRLELTLTDGRTFSTESTSDSLQQSYWSSAFGYDAKILCVPEKPISGDYVIKMHDSYGDGWQGSAVVVTMDGVVTSYHIIDLWSEGSGDSADVGLAQYLNDEVTIHVPDTSLSLEFAFVAGAYPGEVSFEIYGPNSGEVIGAFGPSPAEGNLALNLCNE